VRPVTATTTSERRVHHQDLCRTTGFRLADESTRAEDDGFTIDGYATVYGSDLKPGEEPTAAAGWALIDSWEGRFWERFRQGSFRKAIRERLPRMQFDHGRHPLLGSLPLGVWRSVTEEAEGLHTVGRLSDNWLIEPFRLAMTGDEPSVDGMSIRFEVVREEWRDAGGKVVKPDDVLELLWRPSEEGPLRRTIIESKLPEAGPVTWPAYEATSVGVRSKQVVIDLGRLNEPGQRSELARAVFLADAASTNPDGDEPPATDTPDGVPAGEHSDDEPDSTSTDAPQTTDEPDLGESAGEHESTTPDPIQDDVDDARSSAQDRLYADVLAEMRSSLELTIKEIP
jgi:phage head maturation protease